MLSRSFTPSSTISSMSPISRRRFLALSAATLAARHIAFGADPMPAIPTDLDHILLGINDLDHGIAWLEQRSGVRASFGGVHPGRGTRNALLSLGPRCYLEIIAPDPAQLGQSSPTQKNALWMKLQKIKEPRLVGWAVHTDDLASLARKVVAAGLDIKQPRDGSRSRPDGKLLRSRSFSLKQDRGGLLPFFIEWSPESIHPSQDAPSGCVIQSFAIESWVDDVIKSTVRKLGIDADSRSGKKALLRASITGKNGAFELT